MEKYKCGDAIEFEEGKWDFNSRSVSRVFVSHAKKSIPGYKDVHEVVSGVCRVFNNESTRPVEILDIGCSVGEFERTLFDGWNDTNVHVTAVDSSESMLSDVVFKDSRVGYICEDAVGFLKKSKMKYDIIVCLYTSQFFNDSDSREFPIEVINHLNSGGLFILADKFVSDDNNIDIIKEKRLFDFKLNAGLTIEEIVGKKRALKGVQNRLKESYLEFMLDYGFKDFKILDVSLNFMCYVFYK